MQEKVQPPAYGLIASAAISALLNLASIAMNVLGITMMGMGDSPFGAMGGEEVLPATMIRTISIASSAFGILIQGVVGYGGYKMLKLESHGFALAAAILAAIPCFNGCCLISTPIGIWALVVLNDSAVKESFRG